LAFASILTIGLAAVLAQPAANFYVGKTVQMIIGFGPGGGYDVWGRIVARYLGRHLPGNPTVVPQNMPGAGSLRAASYLYNIAPKDGTVLGIIARDAVLGPLTGAEGARFDSTRLSWIGSPKTETGVCIAKSTAEVKTVQDLLVKPLIVGDTGAGAAAYAYPKALNALLGMRFRNVSGFPTSVDVFLAMERGEVDGICESLDSVVGKRPDWIATKKIVVLFQGGATPNPELEGVPFILDLAPTEESRQAIALLFAGLGIGRPFVAPPDLPADRLKILRDAFDATMKDADFRADARTQKLELQPITGGQLAVLVDKLYRTPKTVVDRVGELIK
jgi:tripartite-type tricarboxylate transporter receptor subunit TctC